LNPPVVWTVISTNVADSNGLLQFTDTNGFAQPVLFYQILFP